MPRSAVTPRMAGFCTSYVENNDQVAAYRANYSAENMKMTTLRNRASELFNKPVIQARIKDLQKFHAKRHNMTIDSISKLYETVISAASAENQFSSVVSAITGLAKLHGLLVDKVEINDNSIAEKLAARRQKRQNEQ